MPSPIGLPSLPLKHATLFFISLHTIAPTHKTLPPTFITKISPASASKIIEPTLWSKQFYLTAKQIDRVKRKTTKSCLWSIYGDIKDKVLNIYMYKWDLYTYVIVLSNVHYSPNDRIEIYIYIYIYFDNSCHVLPYYIVN